MVTNFLLIIPAHYQTDAPSPRPTPHQHDTSSPPSSPNQPTTATTTNQPTSSNVNAAPSNLLVTFLEYCSIIMQDTKTESSLNTVKLSFLILLCVTEDQYANALMHDPNLVFRVKLHRAPMRHRKANVQWEAETNSKSLASAVMDLMVIFQV